jgi:hypothetical protein
MVHGVVACGEEADIEKEADDAVANDEHVLGGEASESQAPFDEDVEEPALPEDFGDPVVDDVASAVDAASRELFAPVPAVSSSSSSSAAAPAVAEAAAPVDGEVSPDGMLRMSPMGYIRCTRPPFNEQPDRTIGLVMLYRDGKTLCGSCHIHPRCAIKVA